MWWISFLLFFGVGVTVQGAGAQGVGARALALSDAGGASFYSIDGLSLNPASLSLNGDLELGGGYGLDRPELSKGGHLAYGWFKDTVSAAFETARNLKVQEGLLESRGGQGFPVGAALVYEDQNLSSDRVKRYQLGLSYVLKRRLSMGLLVEHTDSQKQGKHWASGVGLVHWLTPKWVVGLSGLDLYNDQSSVKPRVRMSHSYRPSTFFTLYADLEHHTQTEKQDISLALETRARRYFSLILSAKHRGADKKMNYGVGAAFVGPRLKLQYGMNYDEKSEGQRHAVDLIIPLW